MLSLVLVSAIYSVPSEQAYLGGNDLSAEEVAKLIRHHDADKRIEGVKAIKRVDKDKSSLLPPFYDILRKERNDKVLLIAVQELANVIEDRLMIIDAFLAVLSRDVNAEILGETLVELKPFAADTIRAKQ